MTVEEMRERMSSAEYESWKVAYRYEEWLRDFERRKAEAARA